MPRPYDRSICGVEIVGADSLARAYRKLASEGTQRRVLRPALSAALTVLKNEMKGRVPAKFKGARGAFGVKVKADKKAGTLTGKVGVAVGFTKAKAEKLILRKRSRPGVGISAANLHWFVLGTADRWTGAKTRRDKRTGEIRIRPTGNPRRFRGRIDEAKFRVSTLVEDATQAGEPQATRILIERVEEGIRREASKSMEQQAREAERKAAGLAKRAANAAMHRAKRAGGGA